MQGEREERERETERERGERKRKERTLKKINNYEQIELSFRQIEQLLLAKSESIQVRQMRCVTVSVLSLLGRQTTACLGGGFGLVYVSVLLKMRTTVRRAV